MSTAPKGHSRPCDDQVAWPTPRSWDDESLVDWSLRMMRSSRRRKRVSERMRSWKVGVGDDSHSKWRDDLDEMDDLREGIRLRALSSISLAYKNQGDDMFQEIYWDRSTSAPSVSPDRLRRPAGRCVGVADPGGDGGLTQSFAAAGAAVARDGRLADSSGQADESVSRPLARWAAGGSATRRRTSPRPR